MTDVVISARFSGRCRRCGEQIAVGAKMRKDNQGRWVHHPLCQEVDRGPDKALEPGVYEMNGTVYVVQQNKAKNRMYAKKIVEIGASAERVNEEGSLVKFDFQYDKGAIFQIKPEHRMTLERAKQLLVRYGRCIRCGRTLVAAQSVERAIGPVCIKYFTFLPETEEQKRDKELGIERESSRGPVLRKEDVL